jgi:hypothetical protein
MSFGPVLRVVTVSTWTAVVLCGCQGDDNALPLPVDAGSHSDATVHDGGVEASSDGALSDAHLSTDAKGTDAKDGGLPGPSSDDGPTDDDASSTDGTMAE